MKNLLLLILIFIQLDLYSQELNTYSIKKIITQERIYTAQINDKYDITIYLKFYKNSDGHKNIYSIKGYYYYNSIKTHIPIVGLYDGDLILYVFSDNEKSDTVLNFKNNVVDFWSNIDYLKNITGYREKFIIKPNEMKWLNGEKSFSLKLYQNDFSIVTETEYLQVNNPKLEYYISLNEIGLYDKNFSIVNIKKIKNETRILLEFDYTSRPYYLGMCGAGKEIGYVILTFDMQNQLINQNRVLIESCLDGIHSEQTSSSNPKIKTFSITDRDEKTTILKLDLDNWEGYIDVNTLVITDEMKEAEKRAIETASQEFALDDEEIPITEQLQTPPPPPPPPAAPEVIEIVEDEETVIESTETDESEEIVEIAEVEVEEVEEDIEVPFAVIENVPVFPGCESGNNDAKRKCMSDKITAFVQKKFNTELAGDLGLTGRQKINVVFKIDKTGKVVGVRSRAPHPSLEKEVARVINLLPQMKPGKQRGKAVIVPYSLPIIFQVQD